MIEDLRKSVEEEGRDFDGKIHLDLMHEIILMWDREDEMKAKLFEDKYEEYIQFERSEMLAIHIFN